jgi:hypothetical protein
MVIVQKQARKLHFRVQYVEPVRLFEFGMLDTRFEVEE